MLSLEQAKTALECVENDIELSKFGETDWESVDGLAFYLRRAELLERLRLAISRCQE
jgi:hypothetical protein